MSGPPEDPAGLFDPEDLGDLVEPAPTAGNVAYLDYAIAAGRRAGRLDATDAAVLRAAYTAARSLDWAERVGGLKAGYLIAQTLRPYQDVLDRLGLNGRAELPTAPGGGGPQTPEAKLLAALSAGPTFTPSEG